MSGKVFSIGGWGKLEQPAFTFKTTEADFYFLPDEPSYQPAPYMASRGLKWIQQYVPAVVQDEVIKDLITVSHRLASLGIRK